MEAIKAGSPVKLIDDVKLDSCITLNEGEVCNIDLNGHTIKGGLFTESNGSFNEGDSDSFVFWNRGGVLNIYGDGVVEAQNAKYSMAVWAQGGTTIINGGTYNGYVNLPENTVDTIRPYGDPIVVKGGVFNFNPTQWLAEGYEAVNNNSCWTVQLK
jgi:hypothetical protein